MDPIDKTTLQKLKTLVKALVRVPDGKLEDAEEQTAKAINPALPVMLVATVYQPEFLERALAKNPSFTKEFPYTVDEFPILNWHLRFAYFTSAFFELQRHAPELLGALSEANLKMLPKLFPETVRFGDYVKAPQVVNFLMQTFKLELKNDEKLADQKFPLFFITAGCFPFSLNGMKQSYAMAMGQYPELASDESILATTTEALATCVCLTYHGIEFPEPEWEERVTALSLPIYEMTARIRELCNKSV